MLWLAATTNRTLVMSPIYDTWPTAIYDPEAIAAYLASSGGYVMPNQVECMVVPHVYASNWSERPTPRTRLGPAVCNDQCSYAGAKSVVLIRDPVEEAGHERVMAMTYDACDFYPVPAERFPAMPFHPDWRRLAGRVWRDLAPLQYRGKKADAKKTLCAHLRREDRSNVQPSLITTVAFIMTYMQAHGIDKLFISHNANATEVEFLQQALPQGAQFGCDSERWSACGDDPSGWQRITTDQAICSHADFFLGSRRSSFTGACVPWIRRRLASHATQRLLVLSRLSYECRCMCVRTHRHDCGAEVQGAGEAQLHHVAHRLPYADRLALHRPAQLATRRDVLPVRRALKGATSFRCNLPKT
jgi:hypothetical protein